jgi:hypothetical protein
VEVSDLKSAQVYYFRFRSFTREGWQGYSQVVSLLVHYPCNEPPRSALIAGAQFMAHRTLCQNALG